MKNRTLSMDKNIRFAAVYLLALCSLLVFSCDGNGNISHRDYKIFAYNLQGTWASNETSVYSGTLVITYDTITITGYGEKQTPDRGGNDAERPFKDFIKDAPLKEYEEEGKMFIRNAGVIQEGLPYTYWDEDYKRIEFLRLYFGGREQILRKHNETANKLTDVDL